MTSKDDGVAPNPSDQSSGSVGSLLIVDDDRGFCDLLGRLLERRSFRVTTVHDGPSALLRVQEDMFDLILLDVSMPSMNGFNVLEALRSLTSAQILMLTARTAVSDKVRGLDGGADDYICKPCDADELLSRINVALRRRRVRTAEVYAFGNHVFNVETGELKRANVVIQLTRLESTFLRVLLSADGKPVGRPLLTAILQERKSNADDRSLDVHVSHLRAKLGRDGELIKTVRGIGYAFLGVSRMV